MHRYLIFLLALSLFGQTGPFVPELASLDRAISSLLAKYSIPGAAAALAKDGRLLYARGFGTADLASTEPVQPDSLFRIASLSKPITAIAVLQLVENSKISLDTRVLPFLGRTAAADPRYADITVRHLLQHSSGMDLETWGFDPSFPDRSTLEALNSPLPPSRAAVLDFVLANLPLAWAPGSRYSYNNIGFLFLTEVIERASGTPYETYVRTNLFAPLGLTRPRIAGSLLTDRLPGEVRYWDKDRTALPIFASLSTPVPTPYGSFHLRIFESGGGWLASPLDLVRFLTALDPSSPTPLLRPATLFSLTERPAYVPPTQTSWYGLGWSILRTPILERWDHDGALPGSCAWFFRGPNGLSFAIAANHLPDDEVLAAFFQEFQEGLALATQSIRSWPSGDLFPVFFPPAAPRLAEAGVVNAASLRPGPLASGSLVKLFGSALAPNQTPTQIRVNGAAVETLWTENGELHFRLPASALGLTRISISQAGVSQVAATSERTVEVLPAAPGLFTLSRNGHGLAAALNEDSRPHALSAPARPGSIVTLFATGLLQPTVLVASQAVEILYSGEAPGAVPGLQQLNIRLPQGLPSGPQPLLIRDAGGLTSQADVFLQIQ